MELKSNTWRLSGACAIPLWSALPCPSEHQPASAEVHETVPAAALSHQGKIGIVLTETMLFCYKFYSITLIFCSLMYL